MPKVKIKKGDQVVVLAGKDKGKKGEILKVLPKENRAFVQGVNMIKRHTKPTQSQAGGIVEREASIHISNLAFVDPKTGEPTRIGYKFLDDNRKVRVARRSGEVIDA
ncbi:MAG: 50S ribosomal protein L24 [Rhodospirillales bacterium]|jgi:large subunit ribosomal protein L24|nr:50S ribosomal protein L24 [Rhodospirillales bacterium]